ncbi:MAG: malate dehydrogenase (oxaloacetate-decarboxylating) [Bradymonadia bacterium]|jgi:malate dehydrogenase (oxaloacetate-decarboxylating)
MLNTLLPAQEPATSYFDLLRRDGAVAMECFVRGVAVLRHPLLNKGTAFTHEERRALDIDGFLPDRVSTLEQQVARAYEDFGSLGTPIDKHRFLRSLQDRQEILYFALVTGHIEEMLPIIYTPTVGDAVKRAGLFREHARGLSFSPASIDRASLIVEQHPFSDVRLIVATDSSAILGLGDLGAGGTEIAIGKLAIYTAAGGIPPHQTLPVTLDVGTNNQELRDDPHYVGANQPRMRGEEYINFIDGFVDAVWQRWPRAIIQWEDLARDAAFEVLRRHREQGPCFNDDIQGTGAVVVAGILAACSQRGVSIKEQRFVLHGAGAGGLGVAWAIRTALERAGASPDDARQRVLVLDSRGLLVASDSLDSLKAEFAQVAEDIDWADGRPGLLETVKGAKPTVLIGLSGVTGAFSEEVVRAMLAECPTPIIMPLSNPTSHAEALPKDLIAWTDGAATVATGSPFEDVDYGGRPIAIGQGNNAFIFPGLGHGASLSAAITITDGMIMAAAEALADYTVQRDDCDGRIYPPVDAMPEASRYVAAAVIREAVGCGMGIMPSEVTPEELVAESFWTPEYVPVIAGERPPEVPEF